MPTPEPSISIEVTSIGQRSLNSKRHFENDFEQGKALIQMKFEEVDGSDFARELFCKVLLKSEADLPLFEIESVIRVDYEVEIHGDFDINKAKDTLSEVGLRVAYPYHRQAIGSAVLQAGLPGFLLPLAADSEWSEMVEHSKNLADDDGESDDEYEGVAIDK